MTIDNECNKIDYFCFCRQAHFHESEQKFIELFLSELDP